MALSDEDRLARIRAEMFGRVGAELLREVARRMRILEGDDWRRGADEAVLDQAPGGRLIVDVGDRQFGWVDPDRPELIAVVDFPAGTMLVIDAEGVVVEEGRRVEPDLN